MKSRAILLAVSIAVTGCQTVAPPPALEQRIDEIIGSASAASTVAVAYLEPSTGRTLLRNADEPFHAASTMKVPVMLAIFGAIDRGELRLDQSIPVRNDFVSIFDGSRYSMLAEEDSDPALYELIGREATLEDLMTRMITRSSNLATNLLVDLVGAERIMTLMKSIGAEDIRVLRGVQDIKAYEAGMNNMVTAHGLMLVMQKLSEREAVSASASGRMLEILLRQEFRRGIPAGLPEGVRVAHKTGSITGHSHDAGIVYPPDGDPYILVVLTRNVNPGLASSLIAEISRAVWESH